MPDKKSCSESCRSTAQKLNIFCPRDKNFTVAINWKMNGDKRTVEEFLKILRNGPVKPGNEVIVAVPALYLDFTQQKKPKFIEIAAQNIYKEKGEFTGEISAEMLSDINIKYVILGASERRNLFKESNELIGEKAQTALNLHLHIILCVGETEPQRRLKKHIEVVHSQLQNVLEHIENFQWKHVIIAYEPLWRKTEPTPDLAQEMAHNIRQWVVDHVGYEIAMSIKIIYGGPLGGTSAKDFARMDDIDGFYTGAASLKDDFLSVINANSDS